MLHGSELRKVRKERDAVVLAMLYRCLEDCCSRRGREQGDRPGAMKSITMLSPGRWQQCDMATVSCIGRIKVIYMGIESDKVCYSSQVMLDWMWRFGEAFLPQREGSLRLLRTYRLYKVKVAGIYSSTTFLRILAGAGVITEAVVVVTVEVPNGSVAGNGVLSLI